MFWFGTFLAATISVMSCSKSEDKTDNSDSPNNQTSTSSSTSDTPTLADFNGEATEDELQVMLDNSELSCTSGDILSFDGTTWSCTSTFSNFQSTGITDDATSETMRLAADGNVGIGINSPEYPLHVNSALLVERTLNDAFSGTVTLFKTKLDGGTPQAISNDDYIGSVWMGGYDGTGKFGAASINARATEDWNATSHGTKLRFNTVENGTLGGAERLTIDHNGNVGVGNSAPNSNLHVSGYIQLDLTSGSPPGTDCDEAAERGRMMVDNVAGVIYVCVNSGWVSR